MDERNFTYMFYGFAAAWLIPVIYLMTLGAREGRLRAEMQRLKTMMETSKR